jgi:nitrogen fixation protein NifU and related proteins
VDRQAIIDRLLDHYECPRHYGALADADLVMPGGIPDCGDTVTIYLKVDPAEGRISDLSFEGRGCSISQGAASLLTDELRGKTLAEVTALSDEDVLQLIGAEVARARPRCATLALHTIQRAIYTYGQSSAADRQT